MTDGLSHKNARSVSAVGRALRKVWEEEAPSLSPAKRGFLAASQVFISPDDSIWGPVAFREVALRAVVPFHRHARTDTRLSHSFLQFQRTLPARISARVGSGPVFFDC